MADSSRFVWQEGDIKIVKAKKPSTPAKTASPTSVRAAAKKRLGK